MLLCRRELEAVPVASRTEASSLSPVLHLDLHPEGSAGAAVVMGQE